jgi:hypothetical protein
MNPNMESEYQKENETEKWKMTRPGFYQILPHDVYRSWRPVKSLSYFVVRPRDTKGTNVVDGKLSNDVEHLKCRDNANENKNTEIEENEEDKYILKGQETLFQHIEEYETVSHQDIKVVGLSFQSYINEGNPIELSSKIQLPTSQKGMLSHGTLRKLEEKEDTTSIFYYARLKAGTELDAKYMYHFDNKLSRSGKATGHGTLTPSSIWNNLTSGENVYHLNENDLCELKWEYIGLFAFKASCVPSFDAPFDDPDFVFTVEVIQEAQETVEDVLYICDIIKAMNDGDIDAFKELFAILNNESRYFLTYEEIQRRDNAAMLLRELYEKETKKRY